MWRNFRQREIYPEIGFTFQAYRKTAPKKIFSNGIFVFLYLAWVFYLYSRNPLAKKIRLPILDEILYALWILDWLFTPKCRPPPPRRPLTPVPQPLSAIPDPQLRGNEAYKRQRADEKRRGTIEAVPLAKAAPQRLLLAEHL